MSQSAPYVTRSSWSIVFRRHISKPCSAVYSASERRVLRSYRPIAASRTPSVASRTSPSVSVTGYAQVTRLWHPFANCSLAIDRKRIIFTSVYPGPASAEKHAPGVSRLWPSDFFFYVPTSAQAGLSSGPDRQLWLPFNAHARGGRSGPCAARMAAAGMKKAGTSPASSISHWMPRN